MQSEVNCFGGKQRAGSTRWTYKQQIKVEKLQAEVPDVARGIFILCFPGVTSGFPQIMFSRL